MKQSEAIKQAIEKAKNSQLNDGEYIITPPCVCQSAAGFYIGAWCVEKDGDIYIPQPYDRFTDYMSEAQATTLLQSEFSQ